MTNEVRKHLKALKLIGLIILLIGCGILVLILLQYEWFQIVSFSILAICASVLIYAFIYCIANDEFI